MIYNSKVGPKQVMH